MAKTVGWVTCSKFPQGFEPERPCVQQLQQAGHRVVPWVWDQAPSQEFDLLVVRSPWDYHLKPTEWLQWIDGQRGPILNPPGVLRWNSDKRYLLELEQRGVPIVPTLLARRGESFCLSQQLGERGWAQAVVKPAVSASAYLTWRTDGSDEPRFPQQLAGGVPLIQPFLPEVTQEGEWSLVFLDRTFSHAVVKRPATGDFRSQEEHGARIEPTRVPDNLLEQARAVLEQVEGRLLYARVDGIWREQRFLLMELELVDPSLFLEHHPAAQATLAELILRELA